MSNSRKRRGLLFMPFLSGKIGGSHISGLTLAKAIQKEGIEVLITAPADAEVLRLAKQFELEGIALGQKASDRRYQVHKALLATPKNLRILLTHRPDAIHCNDLSSLLHWGPAANLLRIPIFYHDRATERQFPKRFILLMARHIITISAFSRRKIGYVSKERKSTVTDPFEAPPPFDKGRAKLVLLETTGWPSFSKLVGVVANFSHRKRPKFFVDVAALLVEEFPDVRFVMFGRDAGISEDLVQAYIDERGLTDKFLLAGFRVPAHENIGVLDVLAAPALNEPFGRTLIEAALLGVPYVATDDGGHSEILQKWKGGLAAKRDASPLEFSALVRRALQRPDEIALSTREIARVQRELSPETHARTVLECYKSNGVVFDGEVLPR